MFILFILQTTFHTTISIGGIAPDLLLVFTCCTGFIRGKKEGMYIGLIAGLLLDLFYGYAGVIGMSGVIFMYLGYANGIFNDVFYTDDICLPVVIAMISDLIYNFIYYCVTFLLRGDLNVAGYFKTIMFPEMIYTGFVAVFAFRILKVINAKLEKFESRGEENVVKGDLGRDN
jgi:rod shape-determining protein MreD